MSDEALVPYRFRRNLVLAASAGTGKTHTLVGVLVHALLGRTVSDSPVRGVRPESVVATTFSRKAAAEIRARLHGAIEQLATAPEASKYFSSLAAVSREIGVDPSPHGIALAASRVRATASEITVGTLHSFASRVVRAHASRAGFPPDLVVDDERAARERRRRAIREALDHALGTSARARLRGVVDAFGGIDPLEDWIDERLDQLAERGARASDVVPAAGDAALIERRMNDLLGHVAAVAESEPYATAARMLLDAWRGGDAPTIDGALAAFAAIKKPGPKAITTAEAELAELYEELPKKGAPKLEKLALLVESHRHRHEHLPQNEALRELLVGAEQAVSAAERAAGALSFTAVLRVARELLASSPDVARAAGRAISVLVVDEFQDTSQVQLDVLKLLRAEPERLERDRVPTLDALRPMGLLVVGDRKQSIYEFRGADVGVFAELCVGLAGRAAREALAIPEGAAWEPTEPSADFVALQHNRRGTPRLLAFANAFSRERFRTPAGAPRLYEVSYAPETEDLRVPSGPGDEAPRDQGALARWIRPASGDAKAAPRRDAELACDAIAAMLSAPSAPRARDVAVLTETNAALDAVAFGLANRGVPHVVAGRGFFQTTEVQDLVAMLRLVERPDDRLALATVLRGPWCGLSDATLLALTLPGAGLVTRAREALALGTDSLADGDELQRAVSLLELVEALRATRERLGARGVLREAIRELRLLEVLVQLPRGAQRVANVEKALRIAGRTRHIDDAIARFEGGMERGAGESEAATFAEDDDAVRLLTIHASKGLAFPIVVLPEVTKRDRSSPTVATLHFGERRGSPELSVAMVTELGRVLVPPSVQLARQDADRRRSAERARLAYVAVTRAEREMVLVGDHPASRTRASVASDSSIAGALSRILEQQRPGAPVLEVGEPGPRCALEAGPSAAEAQRDVTNLEAPSRPSRRLALAPTALADFAHCPRRFELVHVDGLPERARGRGAQPEGRSARDGEREEVPLDARLEGTLAHRVLERLDTSSWGSERARAEASALLEGEGVRREHSRHDAIVARVAAFVDSEYARSVAAGGAVLRREHPFVLRVRGAGLELVLGGTMDLLVEWPNGRLDVVDYKRAVGPDLEPYAFQLDVYRLAALARGPEVRAGIVFLGGATQEPLWRTPFEAHALEHELLALAARLAAARASGVFPRVAVPVCEAIHCGFIRRCHPTRSVGSSAEA